MKKLENLTREELLDLCLDYNTYIMDNAEYNEDFGKSWFPVCIEEYLNNEYEER